MKKLIIFASIALLQACGTSNKGSGSRETSSTAVYAPVVTNSSGGVIQLSWQAGSGVSTGYYVEQSTDGTNWQQIQNVSGTTTSIIGATFGQQYWFRIRAYNSAGTSPYSGVATVTP